jgi:hypothetical protein
MSRHRQRTKRPMHTGMDTQYQRAARMLFLGWSAIKMGRALGKSTRAVRYMIGTPAFQALYANYEAATLARVDRRLPRLLEASLDTLERLLRAGNWKAAETVLIHSKVLERLATVGYGAPSRASVSGPGLSEREIPELPQGMSETLRQKSIEIMRLYRQEAAEQAAAMTSEGRALPAVRVTPVIDRINGLNGNGNGHKDG